MSQMNDTPYFYFENGLIVFTEKYHLERGYCCGSGCRHCPFVKKREENKTGRPAAAETAEKKES